MFLVCLKMWNICKGLPSKIMTEQIVSRGIVTLWPWTKIKDGVWEPLPLCQVAQRAHPLPLGSMQWMVLTPMWSGGDIVATTRGGCLTLGWDRKQATISKSASLAPDKSGISNPLLPSWLPHSAGGRVMGNPPCVGLGGSCPVAYHISPPLTVRNLILHLCT